MKNAIIATAVVALSSGALAAPFVWSDKWTTSKPAEVKTGGVIRRSTFGDAPKTFNPFTSTSTGSILDYVDGAQFTFLDPTTLDYIPYAAEKVTISPNKLVYTFDIREGAKWSDGKPMVADDWVTTFKIYTDEEVGYPNYEDYFINDKPITVSKVDNDTVRFTFPAVLATAIEIAGQFEAWPAHVFGPVYASKGAAGIKAMWGPSVEPEEVVVGGAWKFTGYRTGERMTFAKNPSFGEWNKDSAGRALPYMDGQQVTFYKDQNAQFAAYLAGQLDLGPARNADDLAQIKRAIDAGNLKAVLRPNLYQTSSTAIMWFNWNRAADPEKQRLFRSTEFRRAMSHLMNRKAMVDLAFGGLGAATWGQVPPVYRDWVSPNLNRYDYNPEAAAKLLAGLGYTRKNAEGYLVNRQGKVLEFDFETNAGNTTGEQMARVFVDEAKKAGVKVNFKSTPFQTLVGTVTSKGADRKFDAAFLYFGGPLPLFPFTESVEKCDGGFHMFNMTGKCIAPWETQVTALIERGRQETDIAKRKQIAHQIQNLWSANQPIIYLPVGNIHITYTSRLKGELPAELVNGIFGPRFYALTWISE
jgi:peptide/nickel transport system substrate-binding protein